MRGTEKGLVGHLNKTCENVNCIRYFKPMVIHCIMQVLWGKYLNPLCLTDQ